MNAYGRQSQPGSQPHSWEDTLRQSAEQARRELQDAIAYTNDRIVPEVRRTAVEALHSASAALRRLADHLEPQTASARRAAGE